MAPAWRMTKLWMVERFQAYSHVAISQITLTISQILHHSPIHRGLFTTFNSMGKPDLIQKFGCRHSDCQSGLESFHGV
ncbi:hypothetical protein O181_056728 [Austropuccinia psidii MF-1]|uniref:Uncharacterized protein n=1 Tax=Austropuccinia psidii MF-1 TaxID=1389203 RepID=A0A9Q3HTR3_9BASI|nr:hypothetical protein [Austropuccinia psidii MF-1]